MKIFQDSVFNQKRLLIFAILADEIESQRTLGNKH